MKKLKGVLNEMTVEQRAALEHWLWDDTPTLTYAQARERLQREFGVRTSLAALARFYERRAEARLEARRVKPTERELEERPSLRVFDTLMELGGFAALHERLESRDCSFDRIKETANLAIDALKAQNQAGLLRVRERVQALREAKQLGEGLM